MEGNMNLDELNKVAQAMVAPGRGILAADESSGTIKKRFDAIGVESTEDSRRDYREMLAKSEGWHAIGRAHQKSWCDSRHQGGRRHQAIAVLAR
jgi:hypothetical protein